MKYSIEDAERAEEVLSQFYTDDTAAKWYSGNKAPNWFDHRADLYCWRLRRNSFWIERGCYSRQSIKQGDRVLDLCCGDGFYDYYFYSSVASNIVAVDRDASAIAHARKWHALPNISFETMDLTQTMPEGEFDSIIWDMAIEHFSLPQIKDVLAQCVTRSRALSGCTILVETKQVHPEHQNEFFAPEELEAVLRPFYADVQTFVTVYPPERSAQHDHAQRATVYFRAINKRLSQ